MGVGKGVGGGRGTHLVAAVHSEEGPGASILCETRLELGESVEKIIRNLEAGESDEGT
jgi:hypothetical protein